MVYRFLDGKCIEASNAEEFVRKMRASSWFPEKNVKDFMFACSERGRKIGLDIRNDSEYHFLRDLIEAQIVAVEYIN